MTDIFIIYLGGKADLGANGWHDSLGKSALRGIYLKKLKNSVQNLITIEDVVETLKSINPHPTRLTPNTAFIVEVDEQEYILSRKFEIIPHDKFYELNFTPYIKFDKSNCDISRELEEVNNILKYKNSDEAIKFIKEYISKPIKSYKRISSKPNKILLYHTFEVESLEFQTNSNKLK